MTTIYTKKLVWKRWSGPPKELAAAGQESADEIRVWMQDAKAHLDHDGLAQWEEEPDIGLTMAMKDLTTETDDLTALASIPQRDLRSLKGAWLRCKAWRIGADVSMRIDHTAPAVTIEIAGMDRTRVEGLSARLNDLLGHGVRHPSWYERWFWTVIVGPLIVVLLLGSGWLVHSLGLAPKNDRYELAEVLAISGSLVVSVAIGLILRWLTPDLELLDAGEQSRWRLFGKRFLAALSALLIGITGTAIWAVIA